MTLISNNVLLFDAKNFINFDCTSSVTSSISWRLFFYHLVISNIRKLRILEWICITILSTWEYAEVGAVSSFLKFRLVGRRCLDFQLSVHFSITLFVISPFQPSIVSVENVFTVLFVFARQGRMINALISCNGTIYTNTD